MQPKVRWLIGIPLLMVMAISLGPLKAQSIAYPGSHLFDLETNTSYVTYLTLESNRDGVITTGRAKRSFFVEVVKSETSLHEWHREFIRLEYLAPEEIAGDVFILERFRGSETLYFWNSDLLSPIEVSDDFEFFGDLPVRFFIAFNGSQYRRALGDMDTYLDSSNISQPETLEEKLFIGKEIRLIQGNWEALPEVAEQVKFPRIRTVTYNKRLTYFTELMDADGNVLKEIRNDNWRNYAPTLRQDGSHTGTYYPTQTLYVDHVIPNHSTLSIIDEVGFEQVEQNQFDSDLLGQ